MRVAFFLNLISPLMLSIELFDAETVSQEGVPDATCVVNFTRKSEKHPWELVNTTMARLLGKDDVKLAIRFDKLAAHVESEEGYSGPVTPYRLCRALAASRAVQVAFDVQQKRFRCVSTMKEGEDTWQTAAGPALQATAKDEESAKRILLRDVAEAMAEHPDKALEYAKWHAGGCKVKKLASGKLPPYTLVTDVVNDDHERKLAAKPVKAAPAAASA